MSDGDEGARAVLAAVQGAETISPVDEGGDDHGHDAGLDDAALDDGRDAPISADPAILSDCAKLDPNDTDNGARLIRHFGKDILYVREIGWHHWTGTHWRREDGEHAIRRLAQEVARRIKLEAFHIDAPPADSRLIALGEALAGKPDLSDEERATLKAAAEAEARLSKRRGSRRAFGVSSGNRARCENMIAQAEPHCAVEADAIDADPLKLNVGNGTLIFSRTIREEEDPDFGGEVPVMRLITAGVMRLEPHIRADRITKIIEFAHDPASPCPKWRGFLDRFQPDTATRRFLQVAAGSGLIGGAKTQALIFLYGEGQNGKSVFMEVLAQMIGDYAGRLKPESITGLENARGDQATPDFARLQGKRFVAIAELPRGAPLKEGLVKTMTGGEPMPVRHLQKGFFDLLPEFIPFMSGNQMPEIGGLDKGIWRRMKFVHWPVTVTEAERRDMPEIVAEFMAEAQGILNWLIEGALIFLSEGLKDPPGVTELTQSHREDLDPVGAFLRDCVIAHRGNEVQARDLYTAFLRYCRANAIREWKEKAFSQALKAKGLKKLDGRIRRWLDIGIDMAGIPELRDMQHERDA
jgi:putative DNA primase/helicase